MRIHVAGLTSRAKSRFEIRNVLKRDGMCRMEEAEGVHELSGGSGG